MQSEQEKWRLKDRTMAQDLIGRRVTKEFKRKGGKVSRGIYHGEVEKVTNVQKLVRYCKSRGVDTESLAKDKLKELIEELFQQGLIKVVFATETLAAGINMPARSVVLEKMDKYNGESRVAITPGEYTQLTGRAGRRGIDVEGHSVIVWRDGMNPHALGMLASRRSYPLYSSFVPTYNMAVNLIERYGRNAAREILDERHAEPHVIGPARIGVRAAKQYCEPLSMVTG
jgi:replicative superfamily II helicase